MITILITILNQNLHFWKNWTKSFFSRLWDYVYQTGCHKHTWRQFEVQKHCSKQHWEVTQSVNHGSTPPQDVSDSWHVMNRFNPTKGLIYDNLLTFDHNGQRVKTYQQLQFWTLSLHDHQRSSLVNPSIWNLFISQSLLIKRNNKTMAAEQHSNIKVAVEVRQFTRNLA